MCAQKEISLDPLSARSLYLTLVSKGEDIGSATGFVIQWNDQSYLITNWHVISGHHPETNETVFENAAIPDEVLIMHHGQKLGTWVDRIEELVDAQGNAIWFEYKTKGHIVDVAALPLRAIDDRVKLYPLDLSLSDTDMIPEVAMPISIIGFPLGLAAAGAFPIWKTGHIASDPGLDYKGQPRFLIDATTRSGMSGSPVVLRLLGGYRTKSGKSIMVQSGCSTRFLGVYSGRIHIESEIGMVWRTEVITDLLNHAVGKVD